MESSESSLPVSCDLPHFPRLDSISLFDGRFIPDEMAKDFFRNVTGRYDPLDLYKGNSTSSFETQEEFYKTLERIDKIRESQEELLGVIPLEVFTECAQTIEANQELPLEKNEDVDKNGGRDGDWEE